MMITKYRLRTRLFFFPDSTNINNNKALYHLIQIKGNKYGIELGEMTILHYTQLSSFY